LYAGFVLISAGVALKTFVKYLLADKILRDALTLQTTEFGRLRGRLTKVKQYED